MELAHGGTLFLDEIGEMPLRLQARLLRVLQDKVVTRLGSTRFVQVNVRIICATNRNLFAMARQGQFRQDLFYRINTLLLKIPSLEARREDIGPIVLAYLRRLRGEGYKKLSISDEAIEKLEQQQKDLNKLVTAVEVLASREKGVETDVKEIKADVKTITQKGGKRWDAMIDRVLYVLIGAAISLLMTGGSL